jgi:protein-S-isoprenylcysteine O-methyltransferase Ste14
MEGVSVLTTIAAYLLIGYFLILQRAMRQGEQAKSLQPEQFDRGSTRLIGKTFIIAILVLIAAPALNAFQIGPLSRGVAVGWAGIGFMLGGLALRWWSNRTLGRFYTSTLRVAEGQRIIRQGPYKILRHPGYSGVLLMWVGAGFATLNWVAVTVIMLAMGLSYHYRIVSEEAMLMTTFGEQYQTYKAHTWRLLPFVY